MVDIPTNPTPIGFISQGAMESVERGGTAAILCLGNGDRHFGIPVYLADNASYTLFDPTCVFELMLADSIAKPTWHQIKQLCPEHFVDDSHGEEATGDDLASIAARLCELEGPRPVASKPVACNNHRLMVELIRTVDGLFVSLSMKRERHNAPARSISARECWPNGWMRKRRATAMAMRQHGA
jgi:hypothetical protein